MPCLDTILLAEKVTVFCVNPFLVVTIEIRILREEPLLNVLVSLYTSLVLVIKIYYTRHYYITRVYLWH